MFVCRCCSSGLWLMEGEETATAVTADLVMRLERYVSCERSERTVVQFLFISNSWQRLGLLFAFGQGSAIDSSDCGGAREKVKVCAGDEGDGGGGHNDKRG